MEQQKNNTIIVAGAIVVAGLLIAFGLLASKNGSSYNQQANTNDSTGFPTAEVAINPIDSSEHIVGSPDAEVVLVEYSDIQCPYCQQFHPILESTVDSYSTNEFAWVYRHFPLEQIHPKARPYAIATECAAKQGGNDAFWSYLNTLISQASGGKDVNDTALAALAEEQGLNRSTFQTCYSNKETEDIIDADLENAVAAGGRGTPFNVFVVKNGVSDDARTQLESLFSGADPSQLQFSEDGKRVAISGGMPANTLKQIIDLLRGASAE